MNKNRLYIFCLLLTSIYFLQSCSIGKVLDSTEYVIVEEYSGNYSFTGNSDKYYVEKDNESYMDAFYDELVSQLKVYNIEVISSPSDITGIEPSKGRYDFYTIHITKVVNDETYVVEYVTVDTVNNVQEEYFVTDCDVDLDFEVSASNSSLDEMELKSSYVNAGKSEKLNNNRTFWQILFGTNKDNSQTNYKELNDDVYYSLYGKAGRRVAGKTSKIIYKNR